MPAPYNPTEAFKKYRELQFKRKVFENQGRKNDPEAKEIWKKLSRIFKKLSAEEKTFLTMCEKLDDIPQSIKLPKPPRFCAHETCGG